MVSYPRSDEKWVPRAELQSEFEARTGLSAATGLPLAKPSVPKRSAALKFHILLFLLLQTLDATETYIALQRPGIREIIPFTRMFLEYFGLGPGIIYHKILTSILGVTLLCFCHNKQRWFLNILMLLVVVWNLFVLV